MIEVLAPGILSSVQDIGRYGHRKHGVPLSGAMDHKSYIIANQLVGNDPYRAVFEVYLQGLKLKFHEPTYIALTGAGVRAVLDDKPVNCYSRIKISRGNELHIQSCKKGLFCYVGISGGVVSETVLDSQSFYAGITPRPVLQKGDQFPLIQPDPSLNNYAQVSSEISGSDLVRLDVTKGPEWNHLDASDQKSLTDHPFEVGKQSNRMSFNLKTRNQYSAPQITTAPVQPGTVQMMPSGKIAVLMRDAQTTGGYSRILQLTPESINTLSQVRPGKKVQFAFVK